MTSKNKQFLLFIICSLFCITGYTQLTDADRVRKPSFLKKRTKKKQKSHQEKIATYTQTHTNQGSSKSVKAISSLTTTAKITTDLKGTIWINDKEFMMSPSDTVETKVPLQFLYYFISEDESFISDLKERKVVLAHEKKGVLDLNLLMKRPYRLQKLKTKQEEANTSALKSLQEDMIFVKGGIGGEATQQQVMVDAFEISPYEVTVAQFALFVAETAHYTPSADSLGYSRIRDLSAGNSKPIKKTGITWRCNPEGTVYAKSQYQYPVVHVSHIDAVEFCKWLSRKDPLYDYRLPTAAEWSLAAKGGKETNKYAWGNAVEDFSSHANIAATSLQPVGTYAPNEYGLYDMTGNVSEWCRDVDTRSKKKKCVYKGGSYAASLEKARIDITDSYAYELTHPGIGFRVCRISKLGYDEE